MSDVPRSSAPVTATEIRVLEGPNLYFPRPAVKVSLELPGYLTADEAVLKTIAHRTGLTRAKPGAVDSAARQRFVLRVVERAVRILAGSVGTTRLGVRVRPGARPDQVVTAFVWRHRGRAETLGESLAPLLEAWLTHQDADAVLAEAARTMAAAPAGRRAAAVAPRIPVVSITGTNGKTTTTRLLAHLAMTAGFRTGWSSTDGVVVQGEMVEPGDYSGPAGARGVLDADGVQIGILETARGGMLLKGLGITHNDVSVVTNVSADHLGLQGVDTLDQLAEVKAIVTKATKPGGWVVLNGDDPRVWAMRTGVRAKVWAFSADPDSPALRDAVAAGGRGMTVLDGAITVLAPGGDPDRLLPILDVPVTLSGLSSHNIANVLGATAAALGLGLPRESVIEGLRTFQPDAALNPGRMNTYTVPGADGGAVTIIVDLAHNEAGLEALLDVAQGLRAPGARIHLGLGAAGDRTDEILQNLGEIAGRRADHIVAAHKERYLRGRTMADLEAQLLIGLQRVGVGTIDSYATELGALQALTAAAHGGDVVAIMCHAERAEIYAWLASIDARPDTAKDIRRKVVAARGEHEAESDIAALWALDDDGERIAAGERLTALHPGDARVTYEYAGTFDSAGQPERAVALYREALSLGLPEPYAHRAKVQLASSLRNLGEVAEAAQILGDLTAEFPDSLGIAAFAALAQRDNGDPDEALRTVLRVIAATSADEDVIRYRRSLTAYAESLGR